jgi:hypothetical protein
MILVRDVFQLKFGKAKEAVGLMKKGLVLEKKAGYNSQRLLTDISGPYYTLVAEGTYPDLTEFEKAHEKVAGSTEWRKWYQAFVPLVESGRREIFSIVK